MLFVTLPFLLALWEYNLINIVERMSVEKKNAYIGVDLGGTNMRAGRIVGDPFRVGRECGSYRYRCAERGGS